MGAPTTSSRCVRTRRSVPRPVARAVRRADRARGERGRDRSRAAWSLPVPRRGQRGGARAHGRAPRRAHLGRRDPRDRRLPRASPSPTTRSSARSTKTGPSSRWRATSSCSARTRGRSAGSRPASCGCATPATRAPTVPFWIGEAPARTDELSEEVSALRAGVDELLAAGDPDGARAWLCESTGVHGDAATMIVDYLAVGRAVLGVTPTLQHARARAVLRRDRRHAARDPLAVRRPHQPRVRARAAQEVLPHVQLRAAGRGQRRRDRAVARAAPQLPARRGRALRAQRHRSTTRSSRRCSTRRCSSPGGAGTSTGRCSCCASGAAGATRRRSSAWKPTTSWPRCSRRRGRVPGEPAGPIEIPDHLIVRQTMLRHAARGARRRRAARAARARSSSARCTCTPSTRPSRRCSRTRSSPPRPYAFLDDEELQNRRTNAVKLRRGLSVDLASIGRLEPDAIERVHEEITPDPSRADDLHDLLCSLVVTHAARRLAAVVGRAASSGAASQAIEHDGRGSCGARPRCSPTPTLAFAGDDAAVTATVRGHLELAGITTVDALARLRTRCRPVGSRSRSPCSSTRASRRRARYTDGRGRAGARVGRAPAARADALVLAPRPARRRRAGDRPGLHALPAALAAPRARHAAHRRRRPRHGDRAAPGLGGGRGRRGSPSCSAAGCAATTPARSTACATTARSGGCGSHPQPRDADAPAGPPNKATPISVVFRDDLPWLLEAARAAEPIRSSPTVGATARSSRCSGRGARASRPSSARRPTGSPKTSSAALWDGVTRGLLTSDGFGAIRRRVDERARRRRDRTAVTADARRARPRRVAAGRWSLVPTHRAPTSIATSSPKRSPSCCSAGGASCSATSALRETIRFPWRDVQRALRRLEDRGLVRGGRFVTGFSGEQFALPAAVEQLAHVAQAPAHRRAGHRERDRSRATSWAWSCPASRSPRSAPTASSTSTASPRPRFGSAEARVRLTPDGTPTRGDPVYGARHD